MAKMTKKTEDRIVSAFEAALKEYKRRFPQAETSVYRYSPGSIRIRVIDPHFAKLSRSDRHDEMWNFLVDQVGEDAMDELYLLLPLTRSELKKTLMNEEFEHPTPLGV